jgi:outer membrane lipoprotein SlyB
MAFRGPTIEGAFMSAHPTYRTAFKRARPALFAASILTAAIAATALTACGPRDETPLAGGAAAVAPQTTLQGQPVPMAQTPVAALAPAPAYAPPPPVIVAAAPQAVPAAPAVEPQPVPSSQIGSIASIEPIHERPQGSGAGAVVGGVLGAVVGNQFGHGLGRAAMTGVGAAGGAIAGNNVERNYKEGVVGYRVNVRLDNGHTRTFERTSLGSLHVGDRVRLDAGSFHRV